MEDLLLALLELLIEVGFEFAGEALFDLALRGIGKLMGSIEFRNPVVAAAGYLSLGGFAGYLSLRIVPHPLVHRSRFHGISLVIAPIVVGGAMALLGSLVRERGKRTVQLETFWYAFAFAFGMELIRFLFVA